MNVVQNGIWSGILATSTMTLGFFRGFKMLPLAERSPLPPAILSSQVVRKAGLDQSIHIEGRQNLALTSHYMYGIGCAMAYALMPKSLKRKPILAGTAFGVGVWAVSYLGLIPSLKMRGSAMQMPIRRNALVLGAHLLWGATLGYAENEMRLSGKKLLDGNRKARSAE